MADDPKVLQAANLVKLGMARELKECLAACSPEAVNKRDDQGRSFLHHAAAFGFEECIDVLLDSLGIDVGAADEKGLLPLHYAAVHAQPMCAYNLAKAAPWTCLRKDLAGQTPADAAAECDKGEVLNAMLLACASISSDEAVASMRRLLQAGAVPDTWAPNGSSALMLAASVDCTEGLSLLIEHGATIELQDALGRTALMFAAGSSAGAAVQVLLDAGASLAARDRRNKNILDYAGDDTPVRALLEERMSVLEAAAEKLQAALLASLEDEKPEGAQQQAKAKRKKEKKGRRLKKPAAQCELVKHATSQAESSTLHCDSTSPERSPARPGNDTCQQQGRSNGTAPERDVLASGVADAGQSTEGPPETAADTDGGQTHSSGGEGEHSRNPALGLAGETTSEDEWKVVGKPARKVAPKSTAGFSCAAPTGPQQLKRSQQHSQKACKRCPSLASLTESSGTAESAESDHSVLSAVTVHPSRTHHKSLTPAGTHRAASTASSNVAQQHLVLSRSDVPPELPRQSPAAPCLAAAKSWAGRVAGGAPAGQQQDGRKHTAETAVLTPSTPDSLETASSSHLYSLQQGHAGGMLRSTEHCLSSGVAMYSTCSSAAKPQQAGITTIPEEGVANIPHRASHDNLDPFPGSVYNTASGQNCCAAARAQSESSAAEAIAAKQEASTLRAELQLLRAAMQRAKTAHQQEVAQLLQSAACHQGQLVREAVQAEKDAMAERLLHTFQSLKGLMHAQPFDERCNDASKDIMATLLTPQPAAPSAALLGLSAACQPINGAPASIGYAAFVGDAGHQVYHDDAAAATLGASLSGLVSGLSISAPFLAEASAAPVLPSAAAFAAPNGSKSTESFSFFST